MKVLHKFPTTIINTYVKGWRGTVDTEHTSVSSSSFIYTRTNLEFTRENVIHTNIQINNSDIIQVDNNNSNQSLDPKIRTNQQQPQTGASSANTLPRTWQRKNSHTTKSTHTKYRSTVYCCQQQYGSATYNSKIEMHYRSKIPTMIIMVLSRINTIKRINQQNINYTHTHLH